MLHLVSTSIDVNIFSSISWGFKFNARMFPSTEIHNDWNSWISNEAGADHLFTFLQHIFFYTISKLH